MRPASVAVATALIAACTCWSEGEEIASLDSPVRAVLERVDRARLEAFCAGGHGGGICLPEFRERTEMVVRLPGPPETIQPAEGCRGDEGDAALSAPPDGRRVAWRCGGIWHFAHVGAEGRFFGGGEAPARDGSVDWAAVPTLVNQAPKLVERFDDELQGQLYAEVRATAGDGALVALLVASAHHPVNGRGRGGAWAAAREYLPDAARGAVDAGLVRRILGGGASVTDALLVRALVHARLVHSAPAAVLANLVDDRLGRAGGPPEALTGALLAELAQADPAAAAMRACRIVDLRRPNGAEFGRELLAPAVSALAPRLGACPALMCRPEAESCASFVSSPRSPSDPAPRAPDAATLGASFAFAAPSYPGLVEHSTLPCDFGDLVCAAFQLSGESLRPSVRRGHERRLYRLEPPPPIDTVQCLLHRDVDYHCLCGEPGVREAACRTPAGEATTREGSCTVVIDDGAKTLSVRPLAAP